MSVSPLSPGDPTPVNLEASSHSSRLGSSLHSLPTDLGEATSLQGIEAAIATGDTSETTLHGNARGLEPTITTNLKGKLAELSDQYGDFGKGLLVSGTLNGGIGCALISVAHRVMHLENPDASIFFDICTGIPSAGTEFACWGLGTAYASLETEGRETLGLNPFGSLQLPSSTDANPLPQ